MLNRTVGVGRGCLNYPERPQLCASRVACRENPTEPLCVCVWGGGNQLLPVPIQRGPPIPQGPAPQARALGLVSDNSLLPAPPPHSSLLGLKKPLVIQEFPNSMSLPCSVQAAKPGFRDPEPYYLFLNARYCISPSLQALVSGLRLGPSETPGLRGTHLNVMVCEFGPKFPACPEVQQGHLVLRDGESDVGSPPMLPIVCGGARAHPSSPAAHPLQPESLTSPLPGLLASGLHTSIHPHMKLKGPGFYFGGSSCFYDNMFQAQKKKKKSRE